MAGSRRRTVLLHVAAESGFWAYLPGQLEHMQVLGYDVHAASGPGVELDGLAREHITIHRLPLSRSISPLRDVASILRLRRLLARVRPDIVEAHTTKVALLTMLAAQLAGGTSVRVYHNHAVAALTARGRIGLILRTAERLTAALSSRVVYVAPSIRDEAVRAGLCPADRASSVLSANGIDANVRFAPDAACAPLRPGLRWELGIAADRLVVGYLGKLVPHKGIGELLAAWDRVLELHPTAVLVLAGEEDPVHALPPAVRRRLAGATSSVRWVGRLADPRALLCIADVFVLPSWREAFSYSILEAAAMALPRVTTRIPGTVDQVTDGLDGLLVPPGDARALAEALMRYLGSKELRLDHGRAARQRALSSDLTHGHVWRELSELYAALLEERARSG